MKQYNTSQSHFADSCTFSIYNSTYPQVLLQLLACFRAVVDCFLGSWLWHIKELLLLVVKLEQGSQVLLQYALKPVRQKAQHF